MKSSLGPSNEVMIVECVAGYDGGLPQSFHLEALESASHHLRVNLSRNHSPIFSIEASSFREREGHNTLSHLLLYSANQKGRSEYVIIEDISLNGAQKRPGEIFVSYFSCFLLIYVMSVTVRCSYKVQ